MTVYSRYILYVVICRYIPGIYCMWSYVGYKPSIYHHYKLSAVSRWTRSNRHRQTARGLDRNAKTFLQESGSRAQTRMPVTSDSDAALSRRGPRAGQPRSRRRHWAGPAGQPNRGPECPSWAFRDRPAVGCQPAAGGCNLKRSSHDHLEPCQTRYRDTISRYRYIPILKPISGTILHIPDIGYYPISGFPISGNTRYRGSRYREIPEYPISGFPISGSISGYTDIGTIISRYRVCCKPDIETCRVPMS
jgi:hypothetical protein